MSETDHILLVLKYWCLLEIYQHVPYKFTADTWLLADDKMETPKLCCNPRWKTPPMNYIQDSNGLWHKFKSRSFIWWCCCKMAVIELWSIPVTLSANQGHSFLEVTIFYLKWLNLSYVCVLEFMSRSYLCLFYIVEVKHLEQ